MNATFKTVLVKIVKQAVNAALVTVTPMLTDAQDFNFHNWHGFSRVLSLVGGAVVARELMVWVPVLLKWSQTDASPQEPK